MMTPLDVRLLKIIMTKKNRDCQHILIGREPREPQVTQRLVCCFPGGSLSLMKFCMNKQRDVEEAMTIFSPSSLENTPVKDKRRRLRDLYSSNLKSMLVTCRKHCIRVNDCLSVNAKTCSYALSVSRANILLPKGLIPLHSSFCRKTIKRYYAIRDDCTELPTYKCIPRA